MEENKNENPVFELSQEQKSAVDRICVWVGEEKGSKELKVGGYAGTGKTTIIKEVVKRLLEKKVYVEVVAFTGKAVNVLRTKGVKSAQTMHRLMYTYEQPSVKGQMVFKKKPKLYVDLVVVDEASMVSKTLYQDLVSYPSVRVLFVGDPGQLEPVGEDINLMVKPDLLLTEIHRQAKESNIVQLAEAVRRGKNLKIGKAKDVEVGGQKEFWQRCMEFDQVIVGFNETRHTVNKEIRKEKGFQGELPNVGEKVICLRNNWDRGVFNGMQAKVVKAERDGNYLVNLTIEDDLGEIRRDLPVLVAQFGKDKPEKESYQGLCLFDWGYAITAHKAQGSEWERVVVLEQVYSGWDTARWRYTAITRASKELLYCV